MRLSRVPLYRIYHCVTTLYVITYKHVVRYRIMFRYRMCVHAMKGNESHAKSNAVSCFDIVTRASASGDPHGDDLFRVQLIGLKDSYLYGVDNEIKLTITVCELMCHIIVVKY